MARTRKASRQSRKRTQRGPARPPAQRTVSTGQPGAFAEPMSTAAEAPASPPPRAMTSAAQRGARMNPRMTIAGPSRLTERAIEEYHYVARDLRNIGVLVVVMAVLLVVAFLAFTALGIGKTA
jgi:hypothetical protein